MGNAAASLRLVGMRGSACGVPMFSKPIRCMWRRLDLLNQRWEVYENRFHKAKQRWCERKMRCTGWSFILFTECGGVE